MQGTGIRSSGSVPTSPAGAPQLHWSFHYKKDQARRAFYRADAAEDVVVDLLGCVEHFLIVGRFPRNIVGAVDQDNIVVFAVLVIFDYLIIKGIHGLIVGELLIAEFHEKLMGTVRTFVVDRVLQIMEIFSDSPERDFLKIS